MAEVSRMRTLSFHSGAAFEAGELGHRNGEGPDGTEVVDAREEPRAPADRHRFLALGRAPVSVEITWQISVDGGFAR